MSNDDLLLRMGQDVWHFGLAEQGVFNLLVTPSDNGFSLDGSLLGSMVTMALGETTEPWH